jgi:predicted secreted protein
MVTSLGVAVFFVMWWIVLFAILPIGVRSQQEAGEVVQGTEPGAPVAPQLVRKALLTTLVTAILFAALYAVVTYAGWQ